MKQGPIVELHIIQSFAPSNLNRDDTGAPKNCQFGGVPRARISSQCLKRTAREYVQKEELLEGHEMAQRSRRFITERLVDRLVASGRPKEDAQRVLAAAIGTIGKGDKRVKVDQDGRTDVLLFLGERAVQGVVDTCNEKWDELLKSSDAGKEKTKDGVLTVVGDKLKGVLGGDRAADLAMYGRMLAVLPDANVDAASQVAHAISTHEVRSELDYYTAVDDLNPQDTAGAGMIGAIEFNSACYYRYSNVDVWQLLEKRNLDGDRDLGARTLSAFLQASLRSTPKAKQNWAAAQSPVALAMTVVRASGAWSLVNAFERPVRPNETEGIIEQSVRRLDKHFEELRKGYESYSGIQQRLVWTLHPDMIGAVEGERVGTLPELVRRTVATAFATDIVGGTA